MARIFWWVNIKNAVFLGCSMYESPYPVNVMFPKSRITKAKQLILYPCSAHYPAMLNYHSYFIVLCRINCFHPRKICQLSGITCRQWHTICPLYFDMFSQPLSFPPAYIVAFKCTKTKLILTNYSCTIDNAYIFATHFKLTPQCDVT